MKIAITTIFTVFTLFSVLGQNPKPGSVAANAKIIDADELFPFNEGYAVVQKGNLDAMINSKGDIFIPFGKYWFDGQSSKYNNEASKLNNGSYFHFPGRGFVNGYAVVESSPSNGLQHAYSYINTQGKEVFSRKFMDASQFENGKASVEVSVGLNGHAFLMSGGALIPQKYDVNHGINYELWQQSDLFTYNCLYGKYAYADIRGKVVIPCQYNETNPFSEGVARVMRVDKFGEKKWGYIDTKGKQITDYIFSVKPNDFHNGLAAVMPKDKSDFDYAYIDRTGEIRIKCKLIEGKFSNSFYFSSYDSWVDFKNGYALWGGVPDDRQWERVFVDTLGRLHNLTTLKGSFFHRGKTYNGLSGDSFQIERDFFQDNTILFHWNFGYGLVDINGNIIVPPIFSTLSHFDPISKLAFAVYSAGGDNRTEGYINQQGVFVIVKGKGAKW